MPRSALEYSIGRPLWVAVVVLNVILAAVATSACAWAYLHDTESMRSMIGVLIAVPSLWWVIAVTLWLTTLSRRRVSAEDISRASASVPGGILLPGSKLVPAMTLVAALAAASTFAVVAATVSGVWRVVWALVAVLLLGPVVSHLISLRQPRRLFYVLEPSTREELRGDRVPTRLLDPREALATTPQHVSDPVLATFRPEGGTR